MENRAVFDKLAVLPKIMFDTSGINALQDRGADSVSLMRRLAWEFEVILSFASLEELISTPSSIERHALVSRFQRLLRPAKCIVPPDEMFRLMVSSHAATPEQFEWTKVDVRVPSEFEDVIAQQNYMDDVFCAEHREEQQGNEDEFNRLLKIAGSAALEEVPVQERPTCYQEVAPMVDGDGEIVWQFGRGVHQLISGIQLTDLTIKQFIQACPPFRALCWGQAIGFYGCALRGQRRRKPAGRNDLLMSGYLPYCGYFVTK